MADHCSRIWRPILLACSLSVLGAGAEYLVVSRGASGVWTMDQGESIQINGKEKVRIAVQPGPSWDSKALAHLATAEIGSFAALRRATDGNVYATRGASDTWSLLLPDNAKPQTPVAGAELWTSASIALKHDRKDKAPKPITFSELYAIMAGQDASLAAASLITETALHMSPGLSIAQAFQSAVELVPVAMQTFPTGPAADKIREYVLTSMSKRLRIWANGDAGVETLDQCQALAQASENAFKNDAAQAEVRAKVREARKWLDRRLAILRALDAGRQSDPFLLAYREFEPYDRSFPDLAAARKNHLKRSSEAHVEAAERARADGDYAGAIRNLRIATWRDPQSSEAANKLEQVRIEVARLSAQRFAESRRGIDPRSPKQVQIQRRLMMADQYVADKKPGEAAGALKEAESIDKDEPRIRFIEAKLAALNGDLARALALLDLYSGLAITNQEFDECEKLRASIQYKIENSRKESRTEVAQLFTQQRFAGALEGASAGLKLDNEDPSLLFQTGVNACILRNCDQAAALLRRFLDVTDSTAGKREERLAAMRMLVRASTVPASMNTAASVPVSWFSGSPLSPGLFYDPVSMAFQPKVSSVKGSKSLTVSYEWDGASLKSVHTRYEDKKTASNIAKLAIAGAAASQGIGSTVAWRTPDRETNDFYFNYYDDVPQVLKVDRENKMTKGRRINIPIPGIGGFGALGALGGMQGLSGLGGFGGLSGGLGKGLAGGATPGGMSGFGGLGSMLALSRGARGAGALQGMGGFGGVAGFGGVGGLSAMRAYISSSAMGAPGMSVSGLGEMFRAGGTSGSYSIHEDPQGGSTTGLVTLWNSPRIDTDLAYTATGKRVASVFSGNSFFHPFVWDAIHLFEAEYDEHGRLLHAWETEMPNAPRFDFTWDGSRLAQITAHDPKSGSVVYSRSLNYQGNKLMSETISHGAKPSHIKYKYDKQDRLIGADCDDDTSLDGRSRQIEFVPEESQKGGKR